MLTRFHLIGMLQRMTQLGQFGPEQGRRVQARLPGCQCGILGNAYQHAPLNIGKRAPQEPQPQGLQYLAPERRGSRAAWYKRVFLRGNRPAVHRIIEPEDCAACYSFSQAKSPTNSISAPM